MRTREELWKTKERRRETTRFTQKSSQVIRRMLKSIGHGRSLRRKKTARNWLRILRSRQLPAKKL